MSEDTESGLALANTTKVKEIAIFFVFEETWDNSTLIRYEQIANELFWCKM